MEYVFLWFLLGRNSLQRCSKIFIFRKAKEAKKGKTVLDRVGFAFLVIFLSLWPFFSGPFGDYFLFFLVFFLANPSVGFDRKHQKSEGNPLGVFLCVKPMGFYLKIPIVSSWFSFKTCFSANWTNTTLNIKQIIQTMFFLNQNNLST